jgi:signal transduction histidine kinase
MSALGALVSGVAHEVNTPLGNALIGSNIISIESEKLVNNLNNNTLKKSTLTQRLETINESSILLNKTLIYANDLIKSFKQVSVDQMTEEIRKINLNEYLNEIFLTNKNKLKQISVSININCSDDLNLNTFPGFISQIFNNFIQNSIIHGFEHKKQNCIISVEVKELENNLLYISYKDNGKGVNKEIEKKIFEPFVTDKKNNGGTGLGLSVVYNIVTHKLGGTINLIHLELGCEFGITIQKNFKNE